MSVAQQIPAAGSTTGDEASRKFMDDTFKMIDEYMFGEKAGEGRPVVKLAMPDEIRTEVNLDIGDTGRSHAELRASCEKVLEYSVNTSSPHFHNQLFASCRPEAICGEFLTATSNVSMYTYEVAPVFSVMEQVIFAKMHGFLGWKGGDGIFCPGGALPAWSSCLLTCVATTHSVVRVTVT